MGIPWAWRHNPGHSNSGVNNGPLPSGQWWNVVGFDQNNQPIWEENTWDAQHDRSSNDISNLPAVIDKDFYNYFAFPITWTITVSSAADGDGSAIRFDVAIDQPDGDMPFLKWQQQTGNSSPQFPLPFASHDIPKKSARGFYIANVKFAHAPFTLVATIPDPPPIPIQ